VSGRRLVEPPRALTDGGRHETHSQLVGGGATRLRGSLTVFRFALAEPIYSSMRKTPINARSKFSDR
jgi:hypothetical protein